jgi:hypothetical protein
MEKRNFICEESEIDTIIKFETKMFIWQNQIKGLKSFLKRENIIKTDNVTDKKFGDKKFMTVYYNDKQFIELPKVKN